MPRRQGAWYTDPYGSPSQQRWWDGTRWTREVRQTPPDAPSATVRIAAPSRHPDEDAVHIKESKAGDDGRRVTMSAVVGRTLTVSARPPGRTGRYDILASDRRRVAGVDLYRGGAVALMECTEGAWRRYKRKRIGWELSVESVEGEHVGWYCGRRWSPGGHLILSDGPEFDLHARLGHWTLRAADGEQAIMEIRGRVLSGQTMSIHRLPVGTAYALAAILTTCAVAILDGTLYNAGPMVVGPPGC